MFEDLRAPPVPNLFGARHLAPRSSLVAGFSCPHRVFWKQRRDFLDCRHDVLHRVKNRLRRQQKRFEVLLEALKPREVVVRGNMLEAGQRVVERGSLVSF
jgi:hypothetical protein